MPEHTKQYYQENAAGFIANTSYLDLSEIYQRFIKYLPNSACILDLGCGSGRDALAFEQMGFKVNAMDQCPEFVQHTQQLIKGAVTCTTFSELSAIETYNGIWACASLLHVPSLEMPEIFQKIGDALKSKGVLYTSFKHGEFEGLRNGRWFTDRTLDLLLPLIPSDTLSLADHWLTHDIRPDRQSETWLNCIFQKP